MNQAPEDMLDAYVRASELQSVDDVVPFYALEPPPRAGLLAGW